AELSLMSCRSESITEQSGAIQGSKRLRLGFGHRSRIRGHRVSISGGPAMPMYEFQCADCSKTFDEKESFEEHDRHGQVKCPHCGGTNVQQLVTPVGVKTSKKS